VLLEQSSFPGKNDLPSIFLSCIPAIRHDDKEETTCFYQETSLCTSYCSILTFTKLISQLSFWSYNFAEHEMLSFGNFVTWFNHDDISQVGHFGFIVCHEFASIFDPFPNLGHDLISIDGYIDSLLHLGGNDGTNEGPIWHFPRWRMNQIPSWNGRRIHELFVRHVGQVFLNHGRNLLLVACVRREGFQRRQQRIL
jgi:hypothetical protein